MEYLIQNLPPEVICTQITDEALSLLALAGEKAIPTIAPLEAALPLTAKAWELPGSLLKEKTDLLERGKAERIVWIADSGEALQGLALPPKHFFAARQPDGSHRFYGSNGP